MLFFWFFSFLLNKMALRGGGGSQKGVAIRNHQMHIGMTFLSFCWKEILPKKGGTCSTVAQFGCGSYFNATLIFKIGKKKRKTSSKMIKISIWHLYSSIWEWYLFQCNNFGGSYSNATLIFFGKFDGTYSSATPCMYVCMYVCIYIYIYIYTCCKVKSWSKIWGF